MHLYKDCSDIPLYNFDIIYRTNDLKFLVVGWNGYDEIKVPKGANERWTQIKNEWVKLLGNTTTAYYYQLVLETVYLQTRREAVNIILQRIFVREDMQGATLDTYAEMLAIWDYKWRKGATKENNILRLQKQLKQSENKINLKLDELEVMKKEHGDDGETVSLERQVLVIERSTNIKIDPKKDSIKTWVEVCKMHEEIQSQREKANGK